MAEPALSVILLTRNAGQRFSRVLEGLFACRGVEEAEILMVDSGSTDGTVERAARYPDLRVHSIPPAEFGHGRTRNLAAGMARGEVLVLLVQDAVPADAGLLESLRAPLAEDPAVGAVFARQVARPQANPVERYFLASTYPGVRQVREALPRAATGRTPIRRIFFSNVCSALRREVWRAIPFDERLIMSEDQLWARQALAAGHRIVYEPAAVVEHSHNYRLGELFRRNFDSGFSLRGIADDSAADLVRYEASHLAAGVRYLLRSGAVGWIPYLLLYEAVRAAGFLCGGRALWFPRTLRRRLSLHSYFWD
jgi:rhamnosyltransferase